MRTVVPYTKELKFDSKISEIVSISLEHELNIKNDYVNGDFIISGEYKNHEINVNKDKFFFRLPFSVEITDTINKDSLAFNIEDFNYEIVDDNKLKVDIEFSINAETITIEEEEIPDLEIPLLEEIRNEQNEVVIEEERVEDVSEKITTKLESFDDSYITYYVHIIRDTDTIDTISSLYNVDVNIIKEYNPNIEINIGNKLIIPKEKNE